MGCTLVHVARVPVCAPGLPAYLLCAGSIARIFSVCVNLPVSRLHHCYLSLLAARLSPLLSRIRMAMEPGS